MILSFCEEDLVLNNVHNLIGQQRDLVRSCIRLRKISDLSQLVHLACLYAYGDVFEDTDTKGKVVMDVVADDFGLALASALKPHAIEVVSLSDLV